MDIQFKNIDSRGIKLFIEQDGKEIARAYLYLLHNDLHKEPFGYMEDVFVDESLRGQGIGTEIVRVLIQKARESGCYKLICTSRYENTKAHELYSRLGFKDHGKEFRIDF